MPRRSHVCAIAMVLALLVAPSRTLGGALKGTCALRASGTAHASGTVVWLEQVPAKVEERIVRGPIRWFWQRKPPPPPLPELALRNGRFQPDHAAAVVGAPVLMRNADRQWHGVFSVTPGLGFDLGKRAPGRVDTLRFAHPGTVNVRCDIHPEESAWLLIVPNHAFVRVDSLGRWALPDLPAGTYALRAWRPGARTLRQDVIMPKRGDVEVALHW